VIPATEFIVTWQIKQLYDSIFASNRNDLVLSPESRRRRTCLLVLPIPSPLDSDIT